MKAIKIKIICAWCLNEMGEKDALVNEEIYYPGGTHGICDDCLAKHFPDIYIKVKAIMGDESRYPEFKK